MEKTSSTRSEFSMDSIARVDTDIVTVRGTNNETADCFRYRLTFLTEDKNVTPTVRLISATFRNNISGQAIQTVRVSDVPQAEIDAFTGTLDVKMYSQLIRDQQFSSVICSAASSCMVLDYKGVHLLPEMVALGVLDTSYNGYGNWPFNAAFIASYGLESYIEYCSNTDAIKRELMMGNPVICSVRYKRSASVSGNLPIITNGATNSTNGHLIVVVGYEKDSTGRGYFIVNDPAADRDARVRLQYEENQFGAAWAASGRIAYMTHELIPGAGGSAPVIENAKLVSTGRTREAGGGNQTEYRLVNSSNQTVSVARDLNYSQSGVSIVLWDE
jgi:hypothetical protein